MDGLAWRGKAGWVTGGQGGGARARGGCKGFGSGGGVGGRDTGLRDGARIFVVSNAKKKKNVVFGRMPCGVGGGYPPELAWWTWLQERVGGGVGAMGRW